MKGKDLSKDVKSVKKDLSLLEDLTTDKPKSEKMEEKPKDDKPKKEEIPDTGKNSPVFVYCPDASFHIKLFRDPVFEIKTCLGPMCILLFFSSGVNFFGEAADQYSNLLTF